MHPRICVGLLIMFLLSITAPMADLTRNKTPETVLKEPLGQLHYGSASMNSPMMLAGSIYSNQTLTLDSYGACAILDDLNVWCWGSMSNSVRDQSWNSTLYAESPYKLDKMELPNGTTPISIDGGGQGDVCVILSNSNLSCWGTNYWGVRGDGTTSWNYTPNEFTLPGGIGARAVSLGTYGTTCAIGDDLNAYCWGNSERGKIGHGNNGSSSCGPSHWTTDNTCELNISQVLIPDQKSVISISVGAYHVCAITEDNDLYCWGGNRWGQLGDGTCSPDPSYGHGTTWSSTTCTGYNRSMPYKVPFAGGIGATSVSLHSAFTCATLTNQTTSCWGDGLYGVLGQGMGYPQETANYHTPQTVLIPSNVKPVSVSVSDRQSCALSDIGDIYCWGFHEFGGLGNGTRCEQNGPSWCNANGVGVSTPTKVNDSSDQSPFVGIVLGHQHACAITESENIECWGHNQYGQLGRGYTCDSFSSIQATYSCTEGHEPSETWSPMKLNISSNDITNSTGNELAKYDDLDPDGDGALSYQDRYPLDAARSVYCTKGTYGLLACTDASPGFYVETDGAVNQTACPAGTSSSAVAAKNASTCVTVDKGFYATLGSSMPTPCPTNTTTNSTGATSLEDCLPDLDGDGVVDPPDADNDGVSDVDDLCPNTGSGEWVDGDGCTGAQRDIDGDGVDNWDDLCPNTDPSVWANNDGCAANQLDDDEDGVSNADDDCGDTEEGASVDAGGCTDTQRGELDDDEDGVINAGDLCPNTDSDEWWVDENGCADSQLDNDGDGLSNSEDSCRDENATGYDTDGDGCLDEFDAVGVNDVVVGCINYDSVIFVDENGCFDNQLDDDGDGTMNDADICPGHDDAIDVDADGIVDGCDSLVDSDGDGVGDNADAFPDDANETVDTDGDGVGDNADAFPDDANETEDPDPDGDGICTENRAVAGVCFKGPDPNPNGNKVVFPWGNSTYTSSCSLGVINSMQRYLGDSSNSAPDPLTNEWIQQFAPQDQVWFANETYPVEHILVILNLPELQHPLIDHTDGMVAFTESNVPYAKVQHNLSIVLEKDDLGKTGRYLITCASEFNEEVTIWYNSTNISASWSFTVEVDKGEFREPFIFGEYEEIIGPDDQECESGEERDQCDDTPIDLTVIVIGCLIITAFVAKPRTIDGRRLDEI